MLEIWIMGPLNGAFFSVFEAAKASYCDTYLARYASFDDSAKFSRLIELIWKSERFRVCFGVPN